MKPRLEVGGGSVKPEGYIHNDKVYLDVILGGCCEDQQNEGRGRHLRREGETE